MRSRAASAAAPFVLGGVYAAVIVFGWPVLVMTLLGLADAAFDLRGRVARERGPPQPGPEFIRTSNSTVEK